MDSEIALKPLSRLVEIHKDLRKNVDFTTNNKRRAIWYLQGATISTAYAIWDMYEKGLCVPASHEWRYVNELRDLIKYFEHMDESDRRLKAWYKGHVVERGRNETFPPNPLLPKGHSELESKIRRENSDNLSKFIHPTIQVARFNVYPSPYGEFFEYDWKTLKRFEETLIIYKTAVICSIHGIVLPAESHPIDYEIRLELNELYAVVDAWVK